MEGTVEATALGFSSTAASPSPRLLPRPMSRFLLSSPSRPRPSPPSNQPCPRQPYKTGQRRIGLCSHSSTSLWLTAGVRGHAHDQTSLSRPQRRHCRKSIQWWPHQRRPQSSQRQQTPLTVGKPSLPVPACSPSLVSQSPKAGTRSHTHNRHEEGAGAHGLLLLRKSCRRPRPSSTLASQRLRAQLKQRSLWRLWPHERSPRI